MHKKKLSVHPSKTWVAAHRAATPQRNAGALKMTLLAVLLGAALHATAAPFYLVVPLPARQTPTELPPELDIAVSLSGSALPKATVNQAYSESLRPYLSVTGDPGFDPAAARWSLAGGTLPAGLALDGTTGAVAGTPTAKTSSPASFTVLASYKDEQGQAVYTIEVDGVVLNVKSIAAGQNHTCAVTTQGAAKCWGTSEYGQVGSGSTASRVYAPEQVFGLTSGVTNIAAGMSHTCAVTSQGSVWCWGNNLTGRLGDGTTIQRTRPVQVIGVQDAVSVAVSAYHSCAVTQGGAAQCWGRGSNGQLGDGSTPAMSTTPVQVVGLESGVSAIAAGNAYTCAIAAGGAVKCWGVNSIGQLGDGSTTQSATPVQVVGLEAGATAIATNTLHACAIGAGGEAKCWGSNAYGRLGDGTVTTQLTPVTVTNLGDTVIDVSVGLSHSCAVTSGGAVKCWGQNQYGKLGNGTTTDSRTPVQVLGLETAATSVAAGESHTCATTESSKLLCWGDNFYGQLGDNTGNQSLTPVEAVGL